MLYRSIIRLAPAALLLAAAPLAAQRAKPRPRATSAATKAAVRQAPKPAAAARPDSVYQGFQVDTLAEPLPETLVPRYPASLRTREVRGGVTAEFVVDTLGRIEPATFQVVASDDSAFTRSVRDLIPTARFLPAMNEGHLVRQRVRQVFLFELAVEPRRRPDSTARAPR